MENNKPRTVIEASWEAVNKVGGIHTVLKSKADLPAQYYDNYLLIGPLFPERRDIEFTEQPPPERIRQVFEQLRAHGVTCEYGHWLIKGRPETVLIDARGADYDLDAIKARLWEEYGVDSLHAGPDFDDPLRWAWAVGMFVEKLQSGSSQPIVAHCHEWLAGLALLYLDGRDVPCGTVFTTHATMLGRTIAGGSDMDLYEDLERIDPKSVAAELGVSDKHTTEVACAHAADVFTTVSEVTGDEAGHLLGKKPDLLLYNGIQSSKYPTTEEASVLHIKSREQIRDFLNYHFFSHYAFDLEQSLNFYVSGRYEYRNKGLDVLTEALGRLNEHLREVDHEKTIVVFYFIPEDTHGIKTELLEERAAFTHLQQFINQHAKGIVRKIVRNAGHLDRLGCNDLLSEDARREIDRMAHRMDHDGNPPLVTHNLADEESDPILAGFRAHGLNNGPEDKVKVVRYPIYLTGSDGLLDLSYTDAVAGCHLGLFPSYYEPWGYTPVESAAVGVPSLTTDLAGFGRFIQQHSHGDGIHVLERAGKSHDEVVDGLFEYLRWFCDLDKYGRQDQKLAAKGLTRLTDWETFIKQYYEAHSKAYENAR